MDHAYLGDDFLDDLMRFSLSNDLPYWYRTIRMNENI